MAMESKMRMHRDFRELLSALIAEGAEFLVTGSHAMALQGMEHLTAEMEIAFNPSPTNARRVRAAAKAFGLPTVNIPGRLLATPGLAFEFGSPRLRARLTSGLRALPFSEAWNRRVVVHTEAGDIPVISLGDAELEFRQPGCPDGTYSSAVLAETPRVTRPAHNEA